MLTFISIVMLVAATANELKYENYKHMDIKRSDHLPGKWHAIIQTSDPVRQTADALQNPDSNSVKCRMTELKVANCSNLGITDLSQLNVSSDINSLDLSHNMLSLIPDRALAKFTHLEHLDISFNKLYNLSNDSFFNLTTLVKLSLKSNNLSLSEATFPDDVFSPLWNLRCLNMQNNTLVKDDNLEYPDKALAKLQKLTTLYIDGLPNQIFKSGFNNMTALTNLYMEGQSTGYCNLLSLHEDMFSNLAGLTHLELIHCNISGRNVHPNVFVPLKNLIHLDVSSNDDLKIEPLSAALWAIKSFTKIRFLKMSDIINPYSRGICVKLNFSLSLPPGLEVLNASSNALDSLEDGVLQNLPKSLREIDVGCNKWAFLSYLKDLGHLYNLTLLTLSGDDTFSLPWYYPPDPDTPLPYQSYRSLAPYKMVPLNQPLPPKLHTLNIINAGWSNYLTKFDFDKNNNLKVLNMNFNNFPSLIGPITGLDYLEKLSLAGCRIYTIVPSFFQNLTSLKFLNLSSNYFGISAFNNNQAPFSSLINLILLDISFTDIKCLFSASFEGLDNLKYLLIQRNSLCQFEVDISHMYHLQYINLSANNLVSLSSDMTRMLDNIRKSSTNFTIIMTGNTMNCFCSNLEFLEWMTTTMVVPQTVPVDCSFVDGSHKEEHSLKKIYDKLTKQCASNTSLFFIVTSATLLLILLIAAVTVYNFRWKLRYLYYSAVLHYKSSNDNGALESFEYDVFVSYAHEDHDFVVQKLYPELESNGLTIHIHGLHFTAGDYISSNIVNAVHNSRHTLVVLTEHLVNSKWTKYEIEMANMEQVHTGRSVLIFLIVDDTPTLPTQLLFHVRNNTYIQFPKSDHNYLEMRAFWSKLVSNIKS